MVSVKGDLRNQITLSEAGVSKLGSDSYTFVFACTYVCVCVCVLGLCSISFA